MRVFVQTTLPCSAELAWEAVQTSALLSEVCWPLISFRPVEPRELPVRWVEGETVRVRCYLFGLLFVALRQLRFERIDPLAREIHTRESDALVRRWDHIIRVQPAGGETALYSDEIQISAGPLTPLVAIFAWNLYRHRQRRWRRVASQLAIAP